MKALNQTIGRAIRHKDDYSSIILVDSRFKNYNIIKKLPKWITTNTDYKILDNKSYNYMDLKNDIFSFNKKMDDE